MVDGFLFYEYHSVHVHGMVWHFVGIDKMFSCKDLLCNWEEIAEFSRLFAVVGKNREFFLDVRECVYFTFRGNSRFYLTNKVKQSAINRVKSKTTIP